MRRKQVIVVLLTIAVLVIGAWGTRNRLWRYGWIETDLEGLKYETIRTLRGEPDMKWTKVYADIYPYTYEEDYELRHSVENLDLGARDTIYCSVYKGILFSEEIWYVKQSDEMRIVLATKSTE